MTLIADLLSLKKKQHLLLNMNLRWESVVLCACAPPASDRLGIPCEKPVVVLVFVMSDAVTSHLLAPVPGGTATISSSFLYDG